MAEEEVRQEVIARSRAEFLAEMGLSENDVSPPENIEKKVCHFFTTPRY